MSGRTLASDVLLATSLLVVVLSVFGAVVFRTTFGKLHYVTPVTSVAVPLFGAALVVDSTWGITTGLEILIVVLTAVPGAVLESAIARTGAQRQQLLDPEGPA